MKTRFHLAGTLLLLAAAATASAQYTGPGARGPAALSVATTVAEVLKDPVDDRPVELTGTLMEQTGRETFVFADATGRLTVEIDAEDFPAQPVGPEVRVHIVGEIETRLMREPRVEVEELRLASSAPEASP